MTPAGTSRRGRSALGGALFGLAVAAAAAPQFELPIRCSPGRDCYIQNHFDHDPGPGWRDYHCGSLAYDGHTGTDFRLPDRRRMERGVDVLAAAAGTVVGVRDGEPDISLNERAKPPGPDRAAGNGVRIDHGGGWETQYSHLRRGSIRVRIGDRVEAGRVLAQVGLSGRTEFPHVDFGIRHRGRALDPFAPVGAGDCGVPAGDTLWSPAALAELRYQAGGVLGAGFAGRPLSRAEIESGSAWADELAADTATIVFHVETFGVRAGDVEEIAVIGPDGAVLSSRRETLDRDLAVRRSWTGKRRSTPAWAPGSYVGKYRLSRGNAVVAEAGGRIVIR